MTVRQNFLAGLCVLGVGLCAARSLAAEWEATTAELIAREKPGYGKLCGVAVDHRTGDVYVDLSDRGIYRSADQGKSWERRGGELKPFADGEVTATESVVAACALIRAADLNMFDVAMWFHRAPG